MKDILTDIYNRMVNFFQNENEEENAKDVAYNRLKLVLTQDRMKLDSISAEKLKTDLLSVLAKYMDLKEETYDISFSGEENELAFMFNIGITRTKSFEEIEKYENDKKSEISCSEIDSSINDKSQIDETVNNQKEDENDIEDGHQIDDEKETYEDDEFDGVLIATKDKDGNKIIKKSKNNDITV